MKVSIDQVSQQIIKLALYLDGVKPGSVSEIWLGDKTINDLKASVPTKAGLSEYIAHTNNLIENVEDKYRRQYLSELLHSITFQLGDNHESLSGFYKNTFGMTITAVEEKDINTLNNKIEVLEKDTDKSRLDPPITLHDEILPKFNTYLNLAKKSARKKLPFFPSEGKFTTKLITDKPWTAFNLRVAPFKSILMVNTDYPTNDYELTRLAYHEGYGGHHTELTLKDRLLIKDGRGEHGIVITYSPQTFISEAIAMFSYELLDPDYASDKQAQLQHSVELYESAISLHATFLTYQENMSISHVSDEISKFNIKEKKVKSIMGFVADPTYGRYAAIYYSAYIFLRQLYEGSDEKEELLRQIYTQPTTPSMVKSSSF